MIETIIAYSTRNRFLVIAVWLIVAGWGVYAMFRSPIDAIPDLSENQVIVFADWAGRSPREVEDQLTYPLSVNLQGLAGVKAIRATSEFGFSMINIIFEDDIGFYFARQRVLERLSLAETFLPQGVKPYMAPDATALGQVYWYTVEGEGYDLGHLRAIQDWFVRYQLYSVPGVAEVASVGGYPREYQIDVDPNKLRAYGVTLGELYSAVARSNSAVGGRVLQKGGAEYLVRSIGWIESLDDVRRIVIKSVGGTPIYVSHVAAVQFGSAARRNSLEKNGNEAVGGVVLMRYGENPLEVTQRIKDKIGQLQAGLPEGVRIVGFYDRTRLIASAIETVGHTLLEEMLVASLAILVVMRHVRSAIIICLTLPLAVLTSLIMMRLFDIPSNIMSLSGIAISIGVLVDAAIVMVDQGAHTLHRRFGSAKVSGDTRELVLPSLQTVGRPIFFSLLIMIVSFIPVFALGGMEGRMFHPLAFTKTFALVGVSVLAITLVPALIPLLIRGRVRGEQENWIVRRVIEIYRPVLDFLMDHPWPIAWVTAVILIVGLSPAVGDEGFFWYAFRAAATLATVGCVYAARQDERGFSRLWWLAATVWAAAGIAAALLAADWQSGSNIAALAVGLAIGLPMVGAAAWLLARAGWLGRVSMVASLLVVAMAADRHIDRLGREFMPTLDEGTIMDMPVTIPRASITQVTDDLKARDALLRQFPEVELVVGKAGRAETPTDPAPPDMIETVINLRPRDLWPKRGLRYQDAIEQTRVVLTEMQKRGWVAGLPGEAERTRLVNDAAMHALGEFDRGMREAALSRYQEFERVEQSALTEFAVRRTLEMIGAKRLVRRPSEVQRKQLTNELAASLGPRLAQSPDLVTVRQLAQAVEKWLKEIRAADPSSDLLELDRSPLADLADAVGELLARRRPTFFTELQAAVARRHAESWQQRARELDWELIDRAGGAFTWESIVQVRRLARAQGLWKAQGVGSEQLQDLRAAAEEPFGDALFLWRRTRKDLIDEMHSFVQMPGWGNIWTMPIQNRVDMLATGVRTMIGVKVYGDDLNKIQKLADSIAQLLRGVPGAVDVQSDQVVGEGYLQVDIDRVRAARYGVSVGDIQDVVETALGGQVITTTVEGRHRYPVRIRYARDFRVDEESVKNLLVSAAPGAGGGTMGGAAGAPDGQAGAAQVPLTAVADVRIVEGPSMIKSENGLLRAYVQLNVRDRDLIGFVEEARRTVEHKIKLPAGMYLEWSGQFEHQVHARRTLTIIFPVVILVILMILYVTYHDLVDSLLVIGLAVPGALAGGVLLQYLLGFDFSVAVWVGYIACFGLATENGLVMLVYLREAVARHGGIEAMSLADVRRAVMDGAVHRTRPKLLTEVTTMIGLAPMLWATGTGAEIMQPMAAPVLGGILVSDEIIDLLLPVLFYRVRRWRWLRLHGGRDWAAEVVVSEPAREALPV